MSKQVSYRNKEPDIESYMQPAVWLTSRINVPTYRWLVVPTYLQSNVPTLQRIVSQMYR